MRRLNNKGYMLVEIILAFSICFALMYFLMDLVINLKNKNDDLFVSTLVTTDKTIITNRLMDYVIAEGENFDCSKITLSGQSIKYNEEVLDVVDDIAKISISSSDGYSCKNEDEKISIRIPIDVVQMGDEDFDIVIDYRYGTEEEETDPIIITYDANGGSGAPASQIKNLGEDLVLSEQIPTRSNYGFMGWSISQWDQFSVSQLYRVDWDNNEYFIDYGPEYVDWNEWQTYTKDESATLYAVWKSLTDVVNNYALIFDVNMVYTDCEYYNGEEGEQKFPKEVTVYIESITGDDIYESGVTDFFVEVNVGDKWYVYYDGSLIGSGEIGDGNSILYYGGSSSTYGGDWYYYEFIVDLVELTGNTSKCDYYNS